MGEPASDDYDRYYAHQLIDALEYQDWVQDLLYDHGLPIGSYSSRKFQNQKGENRAGVEIKFDRQLCKTNNLYIETDEKSHPTRSTYTRSGIYRADNTWLYVIGNYTKTFLFAKVQLRALDMITEETGSPRYERRTNPTSKGFLLPLDDACRYAAKVIETAGNSP